MKTYRVKFFDHDGSYNQKLLEAASVEDVQKYMAELGLAIDVMEEV